MIDDPPPRVLVVCCDGYETPCRAANIPFFQSRLSRGLNGHNLLLPEVRDMLSTHDCAALQKYTADTAVTLRTLQADVATHGRLADDVRNEQLIARATHLIVFAEAVACAEADTRDLLRRARVGSLASVTV